MGKSEEHNKAWLGIVLVIVGLAFLTDNLHFFRFNIPHFIFSWEMLFIIIGGAMLVTGRKAGFVFLAIGAFFIVPDLFGFSGMYIRNWWPLILVVIGISMIARRGRFGDTDSSGLSSGSDFDVTTILSGRKHMVDTGNFSGGKVTAFCGGSEIDLSKAKPGDEPAVIDTFVMCGGSTLIVPDDWKVQVDVTCILGGFSDSRKRPAIEVVDPQKTLVLKGFICCGGGEIKSA